MCYSFLFATLTKSSKVVMQNTTRAAQSNSLFYTCVLVQGQVELKGMVDTGWMVTMFSADGHAICE